MSTVKSVAAELKSDARELISAAIRQATTNPRTPAGSREVTRVGNT